MAQSEPQGFISVSRTYKDTLISLAGKNCTATKTPLQCRGQTTGNDFSHSHDTPSFLPFCPPSLVSELVYTEADTRAQRGQSSHLSVDLSSAPVLSSSSAQLHLHAPSSLFSVALPGFQMSLFCVSLSLSLSLHRQTHGVSLTIHLTPWRIVLLSVTVIRLCIRDAGNGG